MLRITTVLFLLIAIPMAFAGNDKPKKKKYKLEPGMYVEFNTSKGAILCELEFEKTPMTVASFVGLAEGKFTAFDTLKFDKPYFDGLTFHRVVPNFVIQGGDPTGTGSGSPGYKFFDETNEELKHSAAGVLSMANSDPRNSKQAYDNTGMTNGSQFFITHKGTPHLDGLHTVFGNVIEGQEVVDAIEQGDTMISVRIIRVGKVAKKWKATDQFKTHFAQAQQNAIQKVLEQASQFEQMENYPAAKTMYEKALRMDESNEDVQGKVKEINLKLIEQMMSEGDKLEKAKDYSQAMNYYNAVLTLDAKHEGASAAMERVDTILEEMELANQKYLDQVSKMSIEEFNAFMYEEVLKTYPDAKQSKTGLVYIIEKNGDGRKITPGDKLSVHYRGTLRRTGIQFDASYDRGMPIEFNYKIQGMIPGFDEGLGMLSDGGKAKLIIPYHLGYGKSGRGGQITPYSDLVFDIEIMSVAPGEEIQKHEHHEGDGHNHDH